MRIFDEICKIAASSRAPPPGPRVVTFAYCCSFRRVRF